MKPSVFLADDDDDDCVLFQDAMNEVARDHELVIAYDGQELLEVLEARVPPEPRVIFIDLNMPRKNGIECLQEIKRMEKLKDIPVVILSTSSQADSIETAYAHGADRYVTKPGTYAMLKKTIVTVLAIDWNNARPISFDQFILSIS
ncbi:MAG TPA: response regulator [Chryseolinea sp.]|nr:response regulator [Chryseolinea sp.]